jgi:hypothetical protein
VVVARTPRRVFINRLLTPRGSGIVFIDLSGLL